MIKERLKSFFLAYFFIPFVFYLVDMACQSTFVNGDDWPFVFLNIILIATAFVSFWYLLTQKFIPIKSPISACIGGILGLMHAFQWYLVIGTFWVWKTVPFVGFTADEKKLFLLNFVNPLVNLYDFLCDGSGPAIIASAIFFVGLTMRRIRSK